MAGQSLRPDTWGTGEQNGPFAAPAQGSAGRVDDWALVASVTAVSASSAETRYRLGAAERSTPVVAGCDSPLALTGGDLLEWMTTREWVSRAHAGLPAYCGAAASARLSPSSST